MKHALLRLARVVSLVLLAGLGTIAMVRDAPGYLTDEREMDGRYAAAGQASVLAQQGSMLTLVREWAHGDLGVSRHYGVPVAELMGSAARVSLRLLVLGTGLGWLLAFALALPLSARRGTAWEPGIAAPATLLLAIPVGALATFCMVADVGGPVLVLAALIAGRDFKLVYRLLRETWGAPHILYARAQGLAWHRVAARHLLRPLTGELFALGMMSFVVALSALVPVEVIFDVPGLGRLAWTAAMNRDLPVLLAVTLVMAACVGVASLFAEPVRVFVPEGEALA